MTSRSLPFAFARSVRGLPALLPVLVLASCGDGSPTLFSPPTSVVVEGSLQTEGTVGDVAAPLPTFRVRDAQGNPVPGVTVRFEVAEGGGTVTPAEVFTDEAGRATPDAWILGPEVGSNRLTVDVGGITTRQVEAWAFPPFGIEAVHLNQGNQYRDGSIGGVAGRPGLLRVITTARVGNGFSPSVLIRLFQGETLLREELVPPRRTGIPTSPNLNVGGDTWNLALTADEVVADLRVEAIVDPGHTLNLGPRDDLRFPREPETTASLDVRATANLELVLIPIRGNLHGGITGDINQGNVGTFLEATRLWIPSPGIEYVIDAPFATDANLTTGGGWLELLSQLGGKRAAEGAVYEYYHGIVPLLLGTPYAGLAYVGSNPNNRHARVGLTFDLLPQASATLAHELGHNMGRLHAPCGNPDGIDQDYPHPNNTIGSPGYDVLAGQLVHSEGRNEYMSYCGPRFASDYTFEATLARMRTDPAPAEGGAPPAAAASRPAGPGLLLWGRIHADRVVLNPAFQVEAPASLPDRGGPHEVRGLAADGRELFRLSFQGGHPAHSPDPEERHFAFVLPIAPDQVEALDRIELRSPRGQAVRRSAETRIPGAPEEELRAPRVSLDRAVADRMELRWEGERFPMAMLRDRETGRVVGFASEGEASLLDPDRRLDNVEILLSDGVRSRPALPR
jgi:hypothetical protein